MTQEPLTVRLRYLVQKNRGLAHFAAKQAWHSWRVRAGFGRDFEEAVSVAYMGLIRAAQYYDPTRGKFSTLAVLVIRRMLTFEAVTRRAVIRVPQAPALAGTRVRVEPLVEDLPRYVSSDEPPDLDHEDEYAAATKALATLPERERQILRLYYEQDLTLEEISARVHLTKERVRQLRDRGLASVRLEMGVCVSA